MRTPLQKEEKIVWVTRSSWTTLVLPGIIALAILTLGSLLVWHGHREWVWLFLAVALSYWIIHYYTWQVNIWAVTNFRVIDEMGLFNQFAKESALDKINNVSYDQTIVGRLLNYGHVKIQTAAQLGATDYFNVNNPKRLKDTITAAAGDLQNWRCAYEAAQISSAIQQGLGSPKRQSTQMANELEKLFDLKTKGALTEEEYLKAKAQVISR